MSGLLIILLVGAICGGLYLLTLGHPGGGTASRTLFAFFPAALLALLLGRVLAKPQAPVEGAPPDAHATSDAPAKLDALAKPNGLAAPDTHDSSESPDDTYTLIGACAPYEADALLAKLEQNGIRFQFDIAKPRVRGLRGPVTVQDPIKIYVHDDDIQKTESLLSSLGKSLGTL